MFPRSLATQEMLETHGKEETIITICSLLQGTETMISTSQTVQSISKVGHNFYLFIVTAAMQQLCCSNYHSFALLPSEFIVSQII